MLRVLWRVLKWTLIVLFVLLVVSLFGGSFLIEIPFVLAFGWIRFTVDNLAAMEINWLLVAEAVACIVVLGFGGHGFARWLYREMVPGAPAPWRPGWTIAGLAGVLLLFVAGIATIGITHQAAWLFTAKGPLLEDPWSMRFRVSSALSSAQSARTAVADSFQRSGRLPASEAEAGLTERFEPTPYALSRSIGPGGVVSIVMAEIIAGGGVVTLTPSVEDATLRWTCRSTLPQKVLPAGCRDGAPPLSLN